MKLSCVVFSATLLQIQQDEILAMKQAGKAGKEIIDLLTNSSATFQNKTEFSQEKYKKRKAKKYVHLSCAKRPTTATLCDMYFNKQPSRIGYLRPDALGILLHMANVGPGSKILVLENCGGMITGAVAERMGGYGSVCATYVEPHPRGIEIASYFNFTPEITKSISRASLLGLLKTRKEQLEKKAEEVPVDDESLGTAAATDVVDNTTSNVEEEATENNNTEENKTEDADGADGAGGASGTVNSSKAPIASPPFSGCILCTPTLHPTTVLKALFPLLAPSASFAVWSQHLQPLAEAMNDLRHSGSAVGLLVQETWYRKQQVLPKRTHPTMNMNHGGGYLLSGIVTAAGTETPMPSIENLS
jgi:tRNA (adenine-N(1)-)-methyltransferase non-catalytic subunit